MRTEPYWWEAAPREARDGALPTEVDVAVVGGGFTGLSAALTLARAGKSVAVLEAGEPGVGASSRNGGMIGSGHRVGFAAASKLYGTQMARELLKEGLNALTFTSNLIEREGVECHFVRCGRFRGAWLPAHYEAMQREAEVMQREIGLETILVPKSEVQREVATDRYHGGCVFPQHGGLHPGLFHSGLVKLAEANGAVVRGHAPVLKIETESARRRLTTPRGVVMAGEVIMATNGYTPPGTPFLSARLVPASSYLIATEPLDEERVRALIPGGRMIVETRSRHCYYRASPDGTRIVLGGRPALRTLDPARTAPVLRRLLTHLFPSLEGVEISHSWQGFVAMTRDSLPHLGKHNGIWYAVGYSGSGVAMAPYLGYKVALKVLGSDGGDTPFEKTPFRPVPFYGGRPWFLHLMDPWYRLKDLREGSP